MTMRWMDYVFADGAATPAAEQMKAALPTSKRSAFVLAVGFDPRCLVGLGEFLGLAHAVAPLIVLIELAPPRLSVQELASVSAATNRERFDEMVADYEVLRIPYPAVENEGNAGPAIARAVGASEVLATLAHCVVDVSSLPTVIFFPLLKALLNAHDAGTDFDGDIQVLVCENPYIDQAVVELGDRSANFVGGFRQAGTSMTEVVGNTVWVPVLGESSSHALEAVYAKLEPDAVCPVLPFPSVNPRRGDALVLELQSVLFDSFQVRSSDLLFASEGNPFDLYVALCNLQRDYKAALEPLAPTRVVLSTHSSKLLSMGVLLAAFEGNMPIVAASVLDYELDATVNLAGLSNSNRLVSLWLAGAPYR